MYIPKNAYYQGYDLSTDLIKYARNNSSNKHHRYDQADVSLDLKIKKDDFAYATCILALQNIENYEGVIINASKYLAVNGRFYIVLNHPYFRIPRQTSWGIDESKKIQYRRVDRYMTVQKIPINMNPGQGGSLLTWSFHRPLQEYIRVISRNGFVINSIEELISDKNSEGKAAMMENRARFEIPMFMLIECQKISS